MNENLRKFIELGFAGVGLIVALVLCILLSPFALLAKIARKEQQC